MVSPLKMWSQLLLLAVGLDMFIWRKSFTQNRELKQGRWQRQDTCPILRHNEIHGTSQ